MKNIVLSLLAALTLGNSVSALADEAGDDLRSLQGTWTLEPGTHKDSGPARFTGLDWIFLNDKLLIRSLDGRAQAAQFKLDSAANPRTITWTKLDDSHAHVSRHGHKTASFVGKEIPAPAPQPGANWVTRCAAYELNGNSLKLILNEPAFGTNVAPACGAQTLTFIRTKSDRESVVLSRGGVARIERGED